MPIHRSLIKKAQKSAAKSNRKSEKSFKKSVKAVVKRRKDTRKAKRLPVWKKTKKSGNVTLKLFSVTSSKDRANKIARDARKDKWRASVTSSKKKKEWRETRFSRLNSKGNFAVYGKPPKDFHI